MDPEVPLVMEAYRVVSLSGVTYQPGERIDTSDLSDSKISQLMNHRLIRPVFAPDGGKPADVKEKK